MRERQEGNERVRSDDEHKKLRMRKKGNGEGKPTYEEIRE